MVEAKGFNMMKNDQILLDHGSGGRLSHQLISEIMVPAFENAILNRLDDGAVIEIEGCRLAFSTDTYVVDPIFFPGGNIGDLAINGTVNDLAMCGATPLFISVGMVIEEGFSLADLVSILNSMKKSAKVAGVRVVTGDTKVVPRGAADKIFINTSGIGRIPDGISVSGHNARPGDRVLLSGTIADHAMTILTQREGIAFESNLKSDTASLNRMVNVMLEAGKRVHVLRDPTRGGVGTALNEVAGQSGVGIKIYEEEIPLRREVAGICELLGFDPLFLANEGKLIAFMEEQVVESVLSAIRKEPLGVDACVIGEVVHEHPGKVFMETRIGGLRIVDMPAGDQLPRIC
jgi:hydrogenase expression/formation protein HypE